MSQWFSLLYKIKPGTEQAVEELFRSSGRPQHDVLNDAGEVVGRLLTTMVFVGSGTCVRVIEVEGDLRDVSRHMGRQPAVRQFEDGIEQYLSEPRDMRSPEGAQRFYRDAGMRCVLIRRHDDPA
jgi:SchA/CurD like domain-containing protein